MFLSDAYTFGSALIITRFRRNRSSTNSKRDFFGGIVAKYADECYENSRRNMPHDIYH